MKHGKFNFTQQQQLLKGLNGKRVEKRKMGGQQMSYLAQHDVRAHLIRLFGFGHFDLITESVELAYATTRKAKTSDNVLHDIGYRVTMRLVIRDEDQNFICAYSESAVGSALSAEPGEAHDNAVKNGASDAMKRCAINLGDQFGLSLYQGGQTAPIVIGTLVVDAPSGTGEKAPVSDEQESLAEPEPETASGPSEAVLDAQRYLYNLVNLPAGERITEVAKFKSGNPELLDATVDDGIQTMTLARYADLVAAGKFNEEEK